MSISDEAKRRIVSVLVPLGVGIFLLFMPKMRGNLFVPQHGSGPGRLRVRETRTQAALQRADYQARYDIRPGTPGSR
jgi:hypothetical protein